MAGLCLEGQWKIMIKEGRIRFRFLRPLATKTIALLPF